MIKQIKVLDDWYSNNKENCYSRDQSPMDNGVLPVGHTLTLPENKRLLLADGGMNSCRFVTSLASSISAAQHLEATGCSAFFNGYHGFSIPESLENQLIRLGNFNPISRDRRAQTNVERYDLNVFRNKPQGYQEQIDNMLNTFHFYLTKDAFFQGSDFGAYEAITSQDIRNRIKLLFNHDPKRDLADISFSSLRIPTKVSELIKNLSEERGIDKDTLYQRLAYVIEKGHELALSPLEVNRFGTLSIETTSPDITTIGMVYVGPDVSRSSPEKLEKLHALSELDNHLILIDGLDNHLIPSDYQILLDEVIPSFVDPKSTNTTIISSTGSRTKHRILNQGLTHIRLYSDEGYIEEYSFFVDSYVEGFCGE